LALKLEIDDEGEEDEDEDSPPSAVVADEPGANNPAENFGLSMDLCKIKH
jgi:hypothetical protein